MPDEYISECARMIAGQPEKEENKLQMDAPLLSVFLGQEAVRYSDRIKTRYSNFWRRADVLEYLTASDFSPENAEDALNRMLMTRDRFQSLTTAIEVIYWDVMDDDFKQHFEKVKQKFTPGGGVTDFYRIHFLFIRQGQRRLAALCQERLRQAIAWAETENAHLVVFSDITSQGLLGDGTIGENYRIAADLVLMSNSYFRQNGDLAPSNTLSRRVRFNLQQNPVYGVGYITLQKELADIAQVALYTILDEYALVTSHGNGSDVNVRDKLCGRGGYTDLLAGCFDELVSPRLPKDPSFLQYLPYTEAVRTYEQTPRDKIKGGGLLANLFGRKSYAADLPVSAADRMKTIYQSDPIYALTAKLYYYDPVLNWLDSEQSRQDIRQHFFGLISSRLNYSEMGRLTAETQEIRRLKEEDAWKLPALPEGGGLARMMDAYIQQNLRRKAYAIFADCLAEVMEYLGPVAANFDNVIQSVRQELEPVAINAELRNAYSSKVSRLCTTNSEQLRRSIHPSDESGLLKQLTEYFRGIADNSIFHYTLVQHLDFVAGSVQGQVQNVIDTYLNQDMTQTCHLKLLQGPSVQDGWLYCILDFGGRVQQYVNPAIHGSVFPTQETDRIERLFVYSVNPELIQYYGE